MVSAALGWGCDSGGGTEGQADDSVADTTAPSDTATTSTPADSATTGSPDTAAPADTTTAQPGGHNPVGAASTFHVEPFTVAPGTERQVCKTINLPADGPTRVVRIHALMEGKSHHFNLYKVVDDRRLTPVTEAEATVHDCAPADEQLSGEAAYIFGSATAERTFDTPQGVAFALQPGQRLILEQHVINFTQEPMEGGVTLELYDAGAEAEIGHHADIMWFGNWGFLLPPNQETSSTKRCRVPYDVSIFGLMSHFHELGVHFSVSLVTAEGTRVVYEDDDWAHPTYQTFWPPLLLKAGESLEWTCTWFNSKDGVVGPNKNSTDEMCITFAAAFPTNALSEEPFQCNVVF